MIRHTIMWKFKEQVGNEDRDAIMSHVEKILSALKPIIPEIRSMRIEKDILRSQRSSDMIYITEFDSLDTLEVYRVHPEHMKVAAYIAEVQEAQAVTDTVIESEVGSC